jgi:hypothetical protein
MDDGAVLWRGAELEERHVGAKTKAAFDVAFAGNTSFAAEPVIPFCRELSGYLAQIIDTFANLVSGGSISLPRAFFPRQSTAGILMLK